jgi:signal transduction histidine kinase/CheY-like chemotaxis protein
VLYVLASVSVLLLCVVIVLLLLLLRSRGALRLSVATTDKTDGENGGADTATELARLSRKLETALEAAKVANTAKSAFLANMSHEMRTPLNSVMGFAELALDYEMSGEPKEYIGNILENSKQLLQLINDILDISKIEAGKAIVENIPFDLHEIFISCQTMAVSLADEKGLALHFYAEPFLGKRLVGDPFKLRQALVNLISNAIKFTSVGMVKVSAIVCGAQADNVTLHFEVRDSGVGMTAEEMQRVLEPFAQADESATRKHGGTGLGLTIIKSFVEMMGGELSLESAPGIGSKFSFDLTFDTIDIPTDNAAACIEIESEVVDRPVFAGEEILVCEDNAMNQEIIRKHLERIGLQAIIAENGKTGVEMVQSRMDGNEKPFDLIFMDIHMPVMDGLEAAAKMKELGVSVPIVALTANIMPGDRDLYVKSGLSGCVGKPFTSQELWRCLLKYLTPADMEPESKPDFKSEPEPELLYDDELLLELKTIFVNDNQNRFAEFMAALNGNNIQTARRIAHTMKSNAGTIGKVALQEAALEIEKSLLGGENLLTEKQINTFETELSKALREFSPFLDDGSVPTPASAPASEAEIPLALTEELRELLQNGSPGSIKFTDALRAVPGCEKLIRQIEDFDFDDALDTLNALMKNKGTHDG